MPRPTVSVTTLSPQFVGQPLILQCRVTTVRGIESRVDITWKTSNSRIIRRITGKAATTLSTSLLYTDYYIISRLNTNDDGKTYQCEVVINSRLTITATSNIVLDAIG